jgi:hypothetical protein
VAVLLTLRKSRALRAYRKRLGAHLDTFHGGHRMFSVAEVRAGVMTLGLSAEFLPYACALYCTQEVFDAHLARLGLRQDYAALRREMLPPPRRRRDAGTSGGDTGGSGGGESGPWWGEGGDGAGDGGGGDGGGGD